MKGKSIKVKVKKTIKQLESLFKEGDTLTYQSVLYDKDIIIVNEIYGEFDKDNNFVGFVDLMRNNRPFKTKKIAEPVIAKKGSFKYGVLILNDGREYPDSCITNAIGYSYSLSDIFEKL